MIGEYGFWVTVMRVGVWTAFALCVLFVASYWTVPHKTPTGWHMVRFTGVLGAAFLLAGIGQTFGLPREYKAMSWAFVFAMICVELSYRCWLLITARREARADMRRRLAEAILLAERGGDDDDEPRRADVGGR